MHIQHKLLPYLAQPPTLCGSGQNVPFAKMLGWLSMPKGPKGEKRPADVIGAAVKVMKIATGEVEEEATDDGKNKAAQELGRLGGAARAKSLSKKKRSDIAKKAAAARWKS